jgi:putative ABC transport system ATP-binding protein
MTSNLIQIENVSFSYQGGMPVLKGLNLEIKKNQLVIVNGESGSGKSSLLKLFNRFNDVTDGRIVFNNKEISEYRIDELRKAILYLPQIPYTVEGTIEDNLTFPFSFQVHKDKKYDANKAGEWLNYFQLNLPVNHEALKLSVGQRQRIALIRAMLLKSEVLLLDEPCSALDSANRKLIEQKIESLIEAREVTVIMATHSKVSFSSSSPQYFELNDGRLLLNT